ncbi:MAG TPA: CbiX/SirB N-terminal domain-containing protein [Usitatibacter sp.]|nr:CbiX/SirB N-terminal domain-containing protein [Usitatibacter sp.]
MHGIVLFAHGARDPEWARPFEAIRDRIRRARPECPICIAYLDAMQPALEAAIAQLVDDGAAAITVFPLFMAQGGHLKEDLPRILERVRGAHAHVPIALAPPVGEVPALLDAIAGWVLHQLD